MAASDEQPIGPRREGEASGRQRGRSENMDRKTIRFSDATVEHAEALVEDGAYPSFSAAIRDQLPGEWPGIGTEGEDE